jgi:hypothetical protein
MLVLLLNAMKLRLVAAARKWYTKLYNRRHPFTNSNRDVNLRMKYIIIALLTFYFIFFNSLPHCLSFEYPENVQIREYVNTRDLRSPARKRGSQENGRRNSADGREGR